jgi:hypothetical protein
MLLDSVLFYFDDTDSTYMRVPLAMVLQRAGVTSANLRDRLEYTGERKKLGRWTSQRIVTGVASFELHVPDSLHTRVSIWATGDSDLPARGVAALMTLLTALSSPLSSPELALVYEYLASQGLSPIQVELVTKFSVFNLTMTYRVLGLERRERAPSSLFAVPSGYTERSLPG